MAALAKIALAYVMGRKRQTLVSVLGVTMGVGFFIGIAAMMQGFQQFFIQKIIDVSPHVTIRDEYREAPRQPAAMGYRGAAIELRGIKPKDEPRGIRSARRIIDALSRRSDLAVGPTLTGQAFLRYGGKDTGVTLLGIDPAREARVSNLVNDLVEGKLSDLQSNPNGIIIGKGIAKKTGLKRGDYVSVVSSAGVILRMKVVGVFETGILALDDRQAYVRLKKNQVLQRRENVINQIRLRLADVEQAERVAREIEARYRYRTESWKETQKNVLSIFVIQNGVMYTSVGAIMLVAGFGIYNIISTVVNEKRHDIAILKSIGFSERDIRIIFLLQGLMAGVAGCLLGWALGRGIIEGLASVRLDIEQIIRTQGFILNRSFWNYAIAGALAIIAATVSAWLPARKAAAVDPVDIIRGAA